MAGKELNTYLILCISEIGFAFTIRWAAGFKTNRLSSAHNPN